MENLIDYLIYALMGYDVRVLKSYSFGEETKVRHWLLSFGFHKEVSIVLDDADLKVIKEITANRAMDDDERARYEKLFKLCQ